MDKIKTIHLQITDEEWQRIRNLVPHFPFQTNPQIIRLLLSKGIVAVEKEVGIK